MLLKAFKKDSKNDDIDFVSCVVLINLVKGRKREFFSVREAFKSNIELLSSLLMKYKKIINNSSNLCNYLFVTSVRERESRSSRSIFISSLRHSISHSQNLKESYFFKFKWYLQPAIVFLDCCQNAFDSSSIYFILRFGLFSYFFDWESPEELSEMNSRA